MSAVNLHHTIFTSEKGSDLPLRSATSFLRSAPERDESPTSQLFASAAYQDLIQRQPTHPNGPMSGWDLGLNLLGDPITVEEHKNLNDYQTKMKLRRLHAINIALELLFGIWGTYSTIRYFLAFVDDSSDARRVSSLVLGIASALQVTLVTISVMIPLFPEQRDRNVWRYARLLLRAGYLFLLGAGPMINLVLVCVWHPRQFCGWDIDISWYTSATNTLAFPCHLAPFGAWIAAAMMRLIVTWMMVLSFIYTLRSYHETRHPFERSSPQYSPYFSSDPEEISPVSASSPLHLLKSKFTRSYDSSYIFNHSNTTLPKYTSISTLAPSTSCTGQSRSNSTPPKDNPPPKTSPPPSRRASINVAHHKPSVQPRSETEPHMLRRKSHVLFAQAMPDTTVSGTSSCSEKFDSQAPSRESSGTRSYASSRPGYRCAGVALDVRRTPTWENANVHAHHIQQSSVSSASFSSTHDCGESVQEKDKVDEDLVYAYGYGASRPTYPYLDMYNPQRPCSGCDDTSSCEDANDHEILQVQGRVVSGGPVLPDASSEPSSLTRDEESSGEEEEYVAMMGGYVRRMATIESLGSKEATGTATTTGSVALQSMSSRVPGSHFSSLRFAEYGSSCTSSVVTMPLSRDESLSTAYLSFSSGGTGMRANERGELSPGPHANRSTAGLPYDCQYYTASTSSFSRMDDEDR